MGGILLATHGGPSAEGAGHVAVLLAARRRVRLHALAAAEPLRVVDSGFGIPYVPTEQEDEEQRSALRAAAVQQLIRCGSAVTPMLRVGMIPMEIAATARHEGDEAIVVGLGSHHLLERALGQETALQLVQVASTPILAVPDGMRALPRHVIAAVDFSPTSIASLRLAAAWLVPGDTLRLVNVATASGAASATALASGADAALAALADELAMAPGIDVTCEVIDGRPAGALLELARDVGADLLTLGSHGYGIWKRLTLGSVASKVIRLSTVAVLVAPIGSLSTGTRSAAAPRA